MERVTVGSGSESESIHLSAGLVPAPEAPEPRSQASLGGPGQENPYVDTISAWVTYPDPLSHLAALFHSDMMGTYRGLCHSHTPSCSLTS